MIEECQLLSGTHNFIADPTEQNRRGRVTSTEENEQRANYRRAHVESLSINMKFRIVTSAVRLQDHMRLYKGGLAVQCAVMLSANR